MISPIDKAIEALPSEHREFLNQIRRFVSTDCAAAEAEMDKTGHPPPAILEKMRELGLFGLTIPEEHGGLGLDLSMFCFVLREIARTPPVVRTYMNINNGIGSRGIVQSGSPEQQERYLPKIAAGEIITAFCLTEPGAGSDAAAITTRAERTAKGWRLNGTKHFITNAPFAKLFTVIAVTDPEKGARGGISAFLVERDNPGLQVGPVQTTMGGLSQHQSEVIFENCEVAEDALLGAIGDEHHHQGQRFVLDDGLILQHQVAFLTRWVLQHDLPRGALLELGPAFYAAGEEDLPPPCKRLVLQIHRAFVIR